MIRTILVAVDDTPAALAGARLAVELATTLHAEVHAVAVVPASQPDAPTSVLDYVRRLAEEADVPVATTRRAGDAAPRILAEAGSVGADVIVLGRSGRSGLGQPYIGSQTREVLEFADVPVVVVPPSR